MYIRCLSYNICITKLVHVVRGLPRKPKICVRHGIPEEIFSDNMPFGSREFSDVAYEWVIKTRRAVEWTSGKTCATPERAIQEG